MPVNEINFILGICLMCLR